MCDNVQMPIFNGVESRLRVANSDILGVDNSGKKELFTA